MKASIEEFSKHSKTLEFNEKPLFLLFNFLDLFEKKIKSKYNEFLDVFPDYKDGEDVEKMKEFIKDQFISVHPFPKKIKCYFGTAIDPTSFKSIFEDIFKNPNLFDEQ